MVARVEAHRSRRPPAWRTIECGGDLVAALREHAGATVLVDSLGTWVAARGGFDVDVAGLCEALRRRAGAAVVVSEEVGLGVHPSSDAGRRFRDALGALNRAVADTADRVLLVVAGRVLPLEKHVP
jgi:adenosyl cobinamide kinase/adenosyl cobinamide phosphate guanylyltransferase